MPTGGCENIAQQGIAAVLVVIALLILWYVMRFMRDKKLLGESMCGGMDQGCQCSGNETFYTPRGISSA